MVGAKVLLPQGVPEFDAACPQYVARSDNLDELTQQVLKILRETNFHLEYDYSVHSPEQVIPLYVNLFNELERNDGYPEFFSEPIGKLHTTYYLICPKDQLWPLLNLRK